MRKYNMYGSDYDDLISLYTQVKAGLTGRDKISIDTANIAFVMGGVDFKRYRDHKPKKEDNNG